MSHDHFGTQREPASEIRMLAENLPIVIVPMEVSFNDQGHLKIRWDRVSVDRLVVRVVDVVHFNVILREVVLVNTDLDSHGVLTDIRAVRVLYHALRQSLRRDRVLVDEVSWLDAVRATVALELTEVLRRELRRNLILAESTKPKPLIDNLVPPFFEMSLGRTSSTKAS